MRGNIFDFCLSVGLSWTFAKTQVLFAYRMCTGELAGPAGKLSQSLDASPLLQNTDPWDILSTLRPLKAKVRPTAADYVDSLGTKHVRTPVVFCVEINAFKLVRPTLASFSLVILSQATRTTNRLLCTTPVAHT